MDTPESNIGLPWNGTGVFLSLYLALSKSPEFQGGFHVEFQGGGIWQLLPRAAGR